MSLKLKLRLLVVVVTEELLLVTAVEDTSVSCVKLISNVTIFMCLPEVIALEYDPNRNAALAAIVYADGRLVTYYHTLKVGDTVESGPNAPIAIGNALPNPLNRYNCT